MSTVTHTDADLATALVLARELHRNLERLGSAPVGSKMKVVDDDPANAPPATIDDDEPATIDGIEATFIPVAGFEHRTPTEDSHIAEPGEGTARIESDLTQLYLSTRFEPRLGLIEQVAR